MAKTNEDLIMQAAIANGGAISSRLLEPEGVSASSLRRRVRAGSLDRPFKGVYIVNALRTPDSLLHAACLAHPIGAAFRFSAAFLHGFGVTKPSPPQFVAAHGLGSRVTEVEMHETRDLPRIDVVSVSGINATSPARTICDISPYLSPDRLRHLIETQLTRNRPTSDQLVACVRGRRRSGVSTVGKLAEMLGLMLDDEPYPESMLELRLFQALASAGVAGLNRQFRPEWYDGIRGIVDAADPVGRTIIEADGRRFRQVTQAHDNDRQRDRKAAAHGFVVLRVGHQELQQRRTAVVSEIREIVNSRRLIAESGVA